MTIFRSEEPVVGIIALAAVPYIAWILLRGLQDRRLPIGKGAVRRDERRGAFYILFGFYIAAGLLMTFIGLDLLVGLDIGI